MGYGHLQIWQYIITPFNVKVDSRRLKKFNLDYEPTP